MKERLLPTEARDVIEKTALRAEWSQKRRALAARILVLPQSCSGSRPRWRGLCRALLATTLSFIVLAGSAAAATMGPPKKPFKDLGEDRQANHQELITAGRHDYVVPFRGNVDGGMTRMPIGYAASVQGWQPNRSVLIENVGRTDVLNPRLVVNGRGDWRSLESIAAEAAGRWTEPGQRARAIYELARGNSFHASTLDPENWDAVKMFNVYGYGLCGDKAWSLDAIWQSAGFRTRRGHPVGHIAGEVFYDDGYHMMDSDLHAIYLERDNETIASEEAITRDHDLIKRTHTYGIGSPPDRKQDELTAALYGYEGKRERFWLHVTRHTMAAVPRPRESLEFRWDHVGKQYTNAGLGAGPTAGGVGALDLLVAWGKVAYDNMRNGRLRYRPDLTDPVAQRGVEASEHVVFDTAAGEIRSRLAENPGSVVWRFRSPYVFVGGRVSLAIDPSQTDRAEWSYSTDGKTWSPLLTTYAGEARGQLSGNLDDVVSPRGNPTYEFFLRLTLRDFAAVSDISFDWDIQTSMFGLPELTVGRNRISYADDSGTERQVRVTHQWLERKSWHPPQPPAGAVSPADGARVEGTRVRFAWNEPSDPDGDPIVAYQFELSAHEDMRWPLSPNFEKLITPPRPPAQSPGRQDSGAHSDRKASWELPYTGLLNPDTDYFWRVRARDAKGVWGAWSRVFRFQCFAPGVPQNLQLTGDGTGRVALSWKPNPRGRRPVAYKVYGSEERGFTASDSEYMVHRGKGFVRSFEEYGMKRDGAPGSGFVKTPSNLIVQSSATSIDVIGANLALPNTNKAFYRVVALDAAGNESGPSDYVEVPRPAVHSQPPAGRVGVPYEYRPRLIQSIGDLRSRENRLSSYNRAFWDREEITLKALSLPEGLFLDQALGTICGVPLRAGEMEIELEVTATPGESVSIKQTVRFEP